MAVLLENRNEAGEDADRKNGITINLWRRFLQLLFQYCGHLKAHTSAGPE
jgi:hypothetical protein